MQPKEYIYLPLFVESRIFSNFSQYLFAVVLSSWFLTTFAVAFVEVA